MALPRGQRARRTYALTGLYAYQSAVAGALALPLSQLAAEPLLQFPSGDALALSPGGLYLIELWSQHLSAVSIPWGTLFAAATFAIFGALIPALYWLKTLLIQPALPHCLSDSSRILGKFLLLGILAWLLRCLLLGFAFTLGLTLLAVLRLEPNERWRDLLAWSPLVAMLPILLLISVLEGLARMALVIRHDATRGANHSFIGDSSLSDALATAFLVVRGRWLDTVGLYIGSRCLALLATLGGAWLIHSIAVDQGQLWRTGLSLLVHQAIVLSTLLLHALWQYHMARWVRARALS